MSVREGPCSLPELPSLLQVVGKDVKHKLRVRVGVDVSVRVGIKELTERRGVDEVSILDYQLYFQPI